MRWRIGSGDSVQVYKSQWIPRPQNFKPIAPATLSEDANVAGLIDANHQWKETLIHQHFSKEDAEKILKIQLPLSPQPDQILWHYDKKGQYSVKSGYQIARKIKHSEESSCSENSSGQWNVIWAMELPEKIKIFMWRAVKNLLPTAENLWKRRVVQDPICSRCKMKAESIVHALWECKPARQMWKLTPYYAEMKVLINQDLLSMMKEIEKRRSKEELRRIVALCWVAWYSRNGSIFENTEQDPHITVAKADATVEAYARVKMGKILAAASNTPEKRLSWLPPPQGFFKANVDAAINEEKREAGLGVVVRDSNGEVIAAAVNRTSFYGNVAQAEAAAVNIGIQTAMEADLLPLIVETDCKEVLDLVLHKQSSRTEIFWNIAEIQKKMSSLNSRAKIQHISRDCNAIAHALAKIALGSDRSCVWKGSFPPQIMCLFSKLC